MERILLYYPTINFPNNNWLRSSLLYSDKVASIFPFASINDKRVKDETKALYDEQLYKPIFVHRELNSSVLELEKFESNFIKVTQSQEFKKIKNQYKQPNTRIGFTDNEMSINTFDMYFSKISFNVANYLRENGDIMFKGNVYTNPGAVEVRIERTSAIVYMSMLADYLACLNKDLVIPSTDETEFERLAYQLTDEKVLTHRIQLDNCLSTPSPAVSIKDIIKFKRDRKHELLNFREMLDKFEGEINSVDDDQERKRKMIQFQEKVQKEIIEIKKLMGDSKLDFILSGFSSLLDFKQKEIIGTISGLGVLGVGVVSSLPLIGLGAGTLLLTGTLVSSYRKINRQVESNSSSYIYYAQKAGILT
jgi:hypothetical protein